MNCCFCQLNDHSIRSCISFQNYIRQQSRKEHFISGFPSSQRKIQPDEIQGYCCFCQSCDHVIRDCSALKNYIRNESENIHDFKFNVTYEINNKQDELQGKCCCFCVSDDHVISNCEVFKNYIYKQNKRTTNGFSLNELSTNISDKNSFDYYDEYEFGDCCSCNLSCLKRFLHNKIYCSYCGYFGHLKYDCPHVYTGSGKFAFRVLLSAYSVSNYTAYSLNQKKRKKIITKHKKIHKNKHYNLHSMKLRSHTKKSNIKHTL